ncbi:DUF6193 family natural product biosynthesis protein [Streptomyces sp. NPDC059766]|uniref:DUF6193 family natural product biosynthesis protein n=1 Tax=Streptomyces sp. NPDC059766 TaxID=3346940 RepID=UPI003650163D
MSEELSGTVPNGPVSGFATLYPEVAQAGSLQRALQAAVDRAGYGFVVELTSSPGWRRVAARAAAGGRSMNVLMAEQERCFILDCWTDEVHMATGSTEDLAQVAGAMDSWLRAPRVRELVEQWPCLRTWELAEAHERGEAVSVRWRQLRAAAVLQQDSALHELVEAAFEQPRLRALSPGRSMYWLTFSRRAAPPICRDLPGAMSIGQGRYRVRFADGRLQEVDGAAQAVAVILDSLPSDAVPPRDLTVPPAVG